MDHHIGGAVKAEGEEYRFVAGLNHLENGGFSGKDLDAGRFLVARPAGVELAKSCALGGGGFKG